MGHPAVAADLEAVSSGPTRRISGLKSETWGTPILYFLECLTPKGCNTWKGFGNSSRGNNTGIRCIEVEC
jgi:hypothetical protein